MLDFLLGNRILPDCQHVFLHGRSVLTNILTCVNDWTRAVDGGRLLISYIWIFSGRSIGCLIEDFLQRLGILVRGDLLL